MPDRAWDPSSCPSQIKLKWMFKAPQTLAPTTAPAPFPPVFSRLVPSVETTEAPRTRMSLLISLSPFPSIHSPLAALWLPLFRLSYHGPYYHRAFSHAFPDSNTVPQPFLPSLHPVILHISRLRTPSGKPFLTALD